MKVLFSSKQLLIRLMVAINLLVWSSGLIHAKTEEVRPPYQIVEEEATGELFFVQNAPHFNNKQKPTVAVALGGGGARALVNVGILKALEEEKIPVDLVVGSSMGAIVAVLYGSGMPIASIEELVTTNLLPSLFDLNFPFIYSVIDTRRVNFFMEKFSPYQRMEEFPIPTALLSYDLTNGVKYIHTSGRISREIQGSYSIPLFFPVVNYDGLYLMDPGILELTPAQAAKVLGADVIISTTAFDALPYNTYDLPIRAWTRFINLQKERNSQEIIDQYSDLTINCEVGDYSFMDYHLAAEFIALGYCEAKKLIPELKRVLAAKNIPLKDDELQTQSEMASHNYEQSRSKLVTDLKYERLRYDFTRIKPIVYYGKEHSFFKQKLLKAESSTLQYGLLWQRGPANLELLTRGKSFDYLEAKFKVIGLTPSVDLIGKAFYEKERTGEQTGYGLDLKYHRPHYALSLGWADLKSTQYLHGGGIFELNWGKTKIKGETDLYTPLSGHTGITGTKYVYSQVMSRGVGEYFTLQPRMVVSNTAEQEVFAPPSIYRGFAPTLADQELFLQSSLQLDYHHRFAYSLELFQCIQLKEISFFSFTDLCYHLREKGDETTYAAGIGTACDLNLLGIKPFIFGGYVAYDFGKASWRGALSLDLSF
ncbi:MAG: hypothetical protein GX050_03830 [Firmicutes bacterium]|nr:hypothetical protein [Bacillota bacterium]